MTDQERELFEQLVKASSQLVTVSMLAADVLSEEFDDLVRPSAEAVRAILAQCPQPEGEWDGTLRDEDIVETTSPAPAPQGESRVIVELTHKITGIARQSYTKPTVEENRAVARRSLEQAVAKRYASLSR